MKTSIRVLVLASIILPLSLVQAQDNDEASEAQQAAETAATMAEQEAPDEMQVEADPEAADAEPVPPTEGAPEDEAVPQDAEADATAEADAGAEAEAESEAETSDAFVLQGHPAFTPEQARLVYQPLVDYLNDATPYRFELQIAEDFHRYWLDIRRGGSPDLTLEEAHMTAYRIDRNDYTPLVKAEEPMTYSLLSATDNPDPTLRELVGRPVSTMPAPSLGYLVLSRWYDNPMQQPLIQSNASSWRDAIEIVFSMEADAAMAPHTLVERYVNLQPVETSREFPGITISAAPSIPEEVQQEIREALLVLHEDENHYEALHELDIDRFVEASAAEYEGLDELLSEIITAR